MSKRRHYLGGSTIINTNLHNGSAYERTERVKPWIETTARKFKPGPVKVIRNGRTLSRTEMASQATEKEDKNSEALLSPSKNAAEVSQGNRTSSDAQTKRSPVTSDRSIQDHDTSMEDKLALLVAKYSK